MKTVAELTDRFRAAGLRVTPQRQAIFALLQGDVTHPTVESLFEASRQTMPTISQRTVYQTVHDLAELGEVRLLDLGTGTFRVDPNVEHSHHHLVCEHCGAVRDLNATVRHIDLPDQEIAGFSVDAVDLIVRGRCSACAPPSA
ncbi:MAG: Fur family transcriptional regulator [Acidimicrobiia bacterium]